MTLLRHLKLSQSMPKMISATGSYWNGHIPVAISNFSGKFIRSFVHWNCRSNSANDVTIRPVTLRLQVNSRPKHVRSRGCSGYFLCPFCSDILIGLVLRFISISLRYLKNLIWNWGMGHIPVFTVWKYLVGGIYQRRDLRLKSVKISVQGPFKR